MPPQAVAGRNFSQPSGGSNGVNPSGGVYRISKDLVPPENATDDEYAAAIDGACSDAEENGYSYFISQGKGWNPIDRTDEDASFAWQGTYTIYRPRNQTTLDPAFPDFTDGQPGTSLGGLWEANGRTVFADENFTLASFDGTLFDICAVLDSVNCFGKDRKECKKDAECDWNQVQAICLDKSDPAPLADEDEAVEAAAVNDCESKCRAQCSAGTSALNELDSKAFPVAANANTDSTSSSAKATVSAWALVPAVMMWLLN